MIGTSLFLLAIMVRSHFSKSVSDSTEAWWRRKKTKETLRSSRSIKSHSSSVTRLTKIKCKSINRTIWKWKKKRKRSGPRRNWKTTKWMSTAAKPIKTVWFIRTIKNRRNSKKWRLPISSTSGRKSSSRRSSLTTSRKSRRRKKLRWHTSNKRLSARRKERRYCETTRQTRTSMMCSSIPTVSRLDNCHRRSTGRGTRIRCCRRRRKKRSSSRLIIYDSRISRSWWSCSNRRKSPARRRQSVFQSTSYRTRSRPPGNRQTIKTCRASRKSRYQCRRATDTLRAGTCRLSTGWIR